MVQYDSLTVTRDLPEPAPGCAWFLATATENGATHRFVVEVEDRGGLPVFRSPMPMAGADASVEVVGVVMADLDDCPDPE